MGFQGCHGPLHSWPGDRTSCCPPSPAVSFADGLQVVFSSCFQFVRPLPPPKCCSCCPSSWGALSSASADGAGTSETSGTRGWDWDWAGTDIMLQNKGHTTQGHAHLGNFVTTSQKCPKIPSFGGTPAARFPCFGTPFSNMLAQNWDVFTSKNIFPRRW